MAFADVGALAQLEGFASRHGPAFYGLPLNSARLRLERAVQAVPEQLERGGALLVPLRAGETVAWRLTDV